MFDNFKIHASKLALIMPEKKEDGTDKKTTAKRKEEYIGCEATSYLSVGALSYLEEYYHYTIRGAKRQLNTPAIKKGIKQEYKGIDFCSRIAEIEFKKNEEAYENDYAIGTPDIIYKKTIIDIKCSYNIASFCKDKKSVYFYQMQAYMWLTGCTEAKVFYVLVNNLDDYGNIINEDLTEDDQIIDYNKLPDKLRYSVVTYSFNPDLLQKIVEKVEKSREFLCFLSKE